MVLQSACSDHRDLVGCIEPARNNDIMSTSNFDTPRSGLAYLSAVAEVTLLVGVPH